MVEAAMAEALSVGHALGKESDVFFAKQEK
jgi:hypothetical protein